MDGSDAWDLDDALGYGRELLCGKRVRLREARESDFEQLTRWWADPQTSVFQSNYLRPTPAPTVSDMMRRFNRVRQRPSTHHGEGPSCAAGRASRTPRAIASAACGAVSEPLNLSGATTILTTSAFDPLAGPR